LYLEVHRVEESKVYFDINNGSLRLSEFVLLVNFFIKISIRFLLFSTKFPLFSVRIHVSVSTYKFWRKWENYQIQDG